MPLKMVVVDFFPNRLKKAINGAPSNIIYSKAQTGLTAGLNGTQHKNMCIMYFSFPTCWYLYLRCIKTLQKTILLQ